MIQTWFKIFYRNSKKNWLNLIINITGLTLGFAGLLVVLLYLNDEQSYNTTNPNKDKIFRVIQKFSTGSIVGVSTTIEGDKYLEEIPEITDYYLGSGWYGRALITFNGKKLFTKKLLVGEPNFFDFFKFNIIEGSTESFKSARNHIALSEKQAKIFFGNESALGKTISFSNRSFIITTIYKIEGKHYYMPEIIYQHSKKPAESWNNFSKTLFIKTTKDPNSAIILDKIHKVWDKYINVPRAEKIGITTEEYKEKHAITQIIEPILDIRLSSKAGDAGPEGAGNYQLILVMLSLSILLIIISCVNFINLSIATATQRAKEVGVKKTLGLSKSQLISQYSLEIIIQCFIAFIFSLLIVELILPYFNEFMYKDISILNINLLLKVAFLALIVAALIGFIPAIYLSKFKAIEVLKGNTSRSKKGVFARNLMLGVQFLISGFFLTASIVISKQVNYMVEKDLGFKGEQVVLVSMTDSKDRYKKYLLARKELIKHPNITAITANSFVISKGSTMITDFKHKDVSIQVNLNAMEYNYLDVMDIKLLKGRNIQQNMASDTIENILINETLAKSFNIYEDPIGKKIESGFGEENNKPKTKNVIGMVKDYHIRGLNAEIPPIVFTHWNTFGFSKGDLWEMQIKINPNNTEETLKFIEDYWKKNVEQGYPFKANFVNENFAKSYEKYQNQRSLFLILTTIVIIVSLLGLFALATLTIQQRLKEVAIRKTLGASVKEIMFQLIKSFLKITVISSVILVPIAYYFIQNWLEDFAYRINMPLWVFIVTPLILTFLVFIVVGLKAYNATKVNLIKHLKFE